MKLLLPVIILMHIVGCSRSTGNPSIFIDDISYEVVSVEVIDGECCDRIDDVMVFKTYNRIDLIDAINAFSVNEMVYASERLRKPNDGLFHSKRAVGNVATCHNWRVKFALKSGQEYIVKVLNDPTDVPEDSGFSCLLRYPFGEVPIVGDRSARLLSFLEKNSITSVLK